MSNFHILSGNKPIILAGNKPLGEKTKRRRLLILTILCVKNWHYYKSYRQVIIITSTIFWNQFAIKLSTSYQIIHKYIYILYFYFFKLSTTTWNVCIIVKEIYTVQLFLKTCMSHNEAIQNIKKSIRNLLDSLSSTTLSPVKEWRSCRNLFFLYIREIIWETTY